jgi:hypothetical protein
MSKLRFVRTGALLLVPFSGLLLVTPALFAEPIGPEGQPSAPQLVRAALESELEGDNDRRAGLLQEAIQADSSFAPARWHSGHVHFRDEWRSLSDVETLAKTDDLLAEYRRLRDSHDGSIQGEQDLASWCGKNGLLTEERAHWLNVLKRQPDHSLAMRKVGLRRFGGMLLSDEQIEQLRAQQKRAEQAMRHWKPILTQLRRQLEWGKPDQRETALADIRAISDPEAIPALEAVFSKKVRTQAREELGLELVGVLAQMPYQEATASLVRQAVFAIPEKARAEAANELKQRPLHSFVPLLLAGMIAPVEASVQMSVFPDGTVRQQYEFFREGASEDLRLVSNAAVAPLGIKRRAPGIFVPGETNPAGTRILAEGVKRAIAVPHAKAAAVSRAASVSRAVQQFNTRAAAVNQRIEYVLATTTGVEYGAEPRLWWDWWYQYNELSDNKEKPVYEYRTYDQASHPYAPKYGLEPYGYGPPASCFAVGTPVWTLTGPLPIEQVRVGDRVLAQDPETGELGYQPVLGTTTRPPSPMLRIDIGTHSLTTTVGHPFWVVGHGWRMAKFLHPGDRVHGVTGSALIDVLEKAKPTEAYNLVVADFGTYFAGTEPVLVHDNTYREPTIALVPGLLRQ